MSATKRSVLQIPDINLGEFRSPHEYAKPELCFASGTWAVRNLVTRVPFTDFVKEHPEIGHYDTDQSYKVAWSVIGNASIKLSVPGFSHPTCGHQKFYEENGPGQNLRRRVKGFEVPTFLIIREAFQDPETLSQHMPTTTYPRSAIECAFNFIDRVAQDAKAEF